MTPTQPSHAVEGVVEALESRTVGGYRDIDGDWCERLHFDKEKVMLALSTLRAEIAAVRPQEPVAWTLNGSLIVREDWAEKLKHYGEFVGAGRAIPNSWVPVLFAKP